MKRYIVEIIVENEAKTKGEGIKNAMAVIEQIGLKPISCKQIKEGITQQQFSALHLLLSQLATQLNESGIDMKKLLKKEVDISWTTYSVKEYLWKPLQKALVGKKSTTELDKIGELELVYDNLNRILIERTGGEINLPPFPSKEL
jgi:hypothetical protein